MGLLLARHAQVVALCYQPVQVRLYLLATCYRIHIKSSFFCKRLFAVVAKKERLSPGPFGPPICHLSGRLDSALAFHSSSSVPLSSVLLITSWAAFCG